MIDADSSEIDRKASRFRTFVLIISANTCLDEMDRLSAQRCEDGDLGASAGHGLGETLSPMRALMNARSARAGISRRQLEWYIGALKRAAGHQHADSDDSPVKAGTGAPVDIAEFQLRRRDVRLPLSWLLSEAARSDIDKQVVDLGTDRMNTITGINLQPDKPSNRKAFDAVMCALRQTREHTAAESNPCLAR